ncbi:MAG: ABC transporter permease [Clostridia bacterium]|nr:ABC transporter permease [Clostridia bacterium]
MDYKNIPVEKFKFADSSRRTGDKKFDTKPVSYAKDVWIRFCKNKSSVVAACIILFLLLFSIFVPIFFGTTYSESLTDTTYLQYAKLLPKSELLSKVGIWDGCTDTTINKSEYYYWNAITEETGFVVMPKIYRADYQETGTISNTTYYDVKMDSYIKNGMTYLTLTEAQFKAIQAWQDETGIQVIYPAVDQSKIKNSMYKSDANIWYENDQKGAPIVNANGDYKNIYLSTGNEDGYNSLRVEGDDGSYRYARIGGTSDNKTYTVRVFKYTYFQYRYGEEPCFLFGTNAKGQDLLTRLAAGARFSLVLAVGVSFVNLFIGAIIGAIEGYYGGVIDIVIERIIDVLGGMPQMVVMALFQLHLASKVGPVWSMIFAFVLTGWIGMAARTRMQFYRFKKQEYVLAARTLGASDKRLMFKHIFPNAMGTLITGSVLYIPGVIFSESSLTYLGIVNLESSTQTSVGTLLSNGNGMLASFPHIILFPALFISLLEISFNLFGNGLRDAFNPSLKGVED